MLVGTVQGWIGNHIRYLGIEQRRSGCRFAADHPIQNNRIPLYHPQVKPGRFTQTYFSGITGGSCLYRSSVRAMRLNRSTSLLLSSPHQDAAVFAVHFQAFLQLVLSDSRCEFRGIGNRSVKPMQLLSANRCCNNLMK